MAIVTPLFPTRAPPVTNVFKMIRFPILFCLTYSVYSMLFPYLFMTSASIGTLFKIGTIGFWWLVTVERVVFGFALVVVAYFGGKSHNKAKWIGGGFCLIASGCLLLALTAFIAPLPEVKQEESGMWKGIYSPATKEDISSPFKMLDSFWGKKFPEDVRAHLNATGYQMLEMAGNENKSKRSIDIGKMEKSYSNALDGLRSEVSLGMEEIENGQQWIHHQHRSKRQMPDFQFPDETRDRLKAGFEVAVLGMIWFGDSYESFAQQVYNLTNDAEIFDRIMKSARLPFSYCRNTSVLVRDRLRSVTCQETMSNLTLLALVLAFVASTMIGIGGAAVGTVGLPYIEDIVGLKNIPKVLVALSCSSYFLAAIGAGLGLVCNMLLYSTMKTPYPLTPIDPRWVGAWWLGLLIIYVVMKLPSVAMLRFGIGSSASANISNGTAANGVDQQAVVPANVEAPVVEKEADSQGIAQKMLDPKQFKGLFDAIMETFQPSLYISLLVALTFHAIALSGYILYLPTYLENNLQLDTFVNGSLVGIAGAVYLGLGVALGAILVHLTNFNGGKLAKYMWMAAFTIFALSLVQKWLGCNSVVDQIQQIGMQNPSGHPNWPSCPGCICESAEFYPVCANDTNRTPYYSPCHAGCTNFTYKIAKADVKFQFDYCACAETPRTLVSREFCQDNCIGVYISFQAIFLTICLLSGFLIVPSIMIILKIAVHQYRSVALGVLGFSICIFGMLPSALLYRFVTDSACFVWKAACGTDRGYCEMYDTNTLKHRFHGTSALLHFLATLFFGLVWYHAKALTVSNVHPPLETVVSVVTPSSKEEETEKTQLETPTATEQNGESGQVTDGQQGNTFIGKL